MKKYYIYLCLAVTFTIIITFSISKAISENSNKIVINEIAAFENSGSEWIEVFNASDAQISLDSWKFYEDSTKHSLKAYQGDLILEPSEYAIIADEAETFSKNNTSFSGTIIDSSWSTLSESGEEIGLVDNTDNFTELFTYIEAKNFSLERKNPYSNDYTSTNWQEHISSHTAGTQNSNFVASTQTTPSQTQQETVIEEVLKINDITNLKIEFNGSKINLNFDIPDNLTNILILKSTQDINATPQNNINYQNENFINNTEIISIQNTATFSDTDFEEEIKYFYKIFTFDDNFNYSIGTQTSIQVPYIIKSNDILINEIVASPQDDEEEWIELFNQTNNDIDLTDSFLQDTSGTKEILSSIIKNKTYLIIEKPSFAINNSEEKISLYNSFGQLINEISYGGESKISAPSKGKSIGFFNNELITFSNPTKNSENKIINNAPIAVINIQSGETTGIGKLKINLDGSASYDPDSDNLNFYWDFGDGETSTSSNPNTKTFDSPGDYQISLTVTDIFGEKDTEILKVKVKKEEAKSSKSKQSKNTSSTSDEAEKKSTPSETTADETQINSDNFKFIKISEFIPNPEGTDEENEWIELYNTADFDINLNGLQIDDNEDGSNPYSLNETITAKNFLVLEIQKTNITLNQDIDSVRLIYENEIVDEVNYEDSKEGFSYAQFEAEWKWTDFPTKGSSNILNETINENIESEEVSSETQTSTNDESLPNETSQTIEPTAYEALFINELLPNPYGKDNSQEWIEIYNPNDKKINLQNWTLDDMEGGSKPYVFKEKTIIDPQDFLVIYSYNSKLNLNNDTDDVRLFTPQNMLSDTIHYEKAAEGLAYAKFENVFDWTDSPSPNSENIFSKTEDTEEENEKETSENKKYKDGNLSDKIFISEILPNPSGKESDKEWIEIYNADDKNINLGNWYLMDNSKNEKKFIFPDSNSIKAKSYLVIPRKLSKIALDNGKDSLYLYNFEDELIHEISYEKSIEDQSYALIEILNDEGNINQKFSFINAAFAANEETNMWTWIDDPSPGKQNPIFHKIAGEISNQANGYVYLKMLNGREIQLNLAKTINNEDLSNSILNNGTKIEVLAEKINEKAFNLKELTLIQSSDESNAIENNNRNKKLAIIISIIIFATSLSIFKFKDRIKLFILNI